MLTVRLRIPKTPALVNPPVPDAEPPVHELDGWRLTQSEQLCECTGSPCLHFRACPGCRHVVLQCERTLDVLPDPRRLSRITAEKFTCPRCGDFGAEAFEAAEMAQILALGFELGDYC